MQAIKNLLTGHSTDAAHADAAHHNTAGAVDSAHVDHHGRAAATTPVKAVHKHTNGALPGNFAVANDSGAVVGEGGTDFDQPSMGTAPAMRPLAPNHQEHEHMKASTAAVPLAAGAAALPHHHHDHHTAAAPLPAHHEHQHMTAPLPTQVLKEESLPVAVQKTYEQPITVETKQFVPVVMEKTLEQEALMRKTDVLAATVERREWLQVDQNAHMDVNEQTILKSELREVASEIRVIPKPPMTTASGVHMGEAHNETVVRHLPAGEFKMVDAVLLPNTAAGIHSTHLSLEQQSQSSSLSGLDQTRTMHHDATHTHHHDATRHDASHMAGASSAGLGGAALAKDRDHLTQKGEALLANNNLHVIDEDRRMAEQQAGMKRHSGSHDSKHMTADERTHNKHTDALPNNRNSVQGVLPEPDRRG